jgi:CheY-like chemotaxis protein
VLAVEDNPEMLTLFRHLLASVCDVFTAMDMQTALAAVAANQFDAVLMDINLGTEETGVDVLHALRAIPAYERVPVVAVTAYALPGDRERFLEEGFDAYIGKPFTRQQLTRMLERILAG